MGFLEILSLLSDVMLYIVRGVAGEFNPATTRYFNHWLVVKWFNYRSDVRSSCQNYEHMVTCSYKASGFFVLFCFLADCTQTVPFSRCIQMLIENSTINPKMCSYEE